VADFPEGKSATFAMTALRAGSFLMDSRATEGRAGIHHCKLSSLKQH